ncbi:MAG: DUF1761 domain-containing protein, partial [Lewinellaceae bacterium]|nr:DUF1761 domain-containing protein [Lewinellaceae bacterium]
METNWIALLVAAVIPLVIGGLWYHPKVMGTAWMKASGITEEQIRSGNMAKIFGLTFLFSLMLATFMNVLVIHQYAINSILVNEPGFGDPNSEVGMYIADFMARYGTNFRTFSHGATH